MVSKRRLKPSIRERPVKPVPRLLSPSVQPNLPTEGWRMQRIGLRFAAVRAALTILPGCEHAMPEDTTFDREYIAPSSQ